MNNTKWLEIFKAFYENECATPSILVPWMTQSTDGYVYGWDCTWTHFGCDEPEYNKIEWLKIKLTPENRHFVVSTLKKIHVPGEITENEAIVYGYRTDVSYI